MSEFQPVSYAEGVTPPSAAHVTLSDFPFEGTLTRLRAAIQAEDLWLIHEIDPQMIVKRGGYDIGPARQLLFFHPRYMVRLLQGNPHALVEVPLKFAILELPGGGVSVGHPKVETLAAYPGLEVLAAELEALYFRLEACLRASTS